MKKYLSNKYTIAIICLFAFHIFFRFYNLEKWASFNWDQIDNAWASLRIILAHKYPLVGMVAKANSGLYIGPLYYYLTALFYSITRLDPIASPLLAGVTGIFSFITLAFVTKRLFNKKIALVSCFIYAFSSYIIEFERSQWPVNFIAPVSLLIFYYLYRVITGKPKYLIHLSIVLGLSFQIHFTSIFYPIIVLLSLPFLPFNKKSVKYYALSIFIVMVSLIPQILYYTKANSHNANTIRSYFRTFYHGFHLRRVWQLAPDAFIKFVSLLNTPYDFLRNSVFLFIPVFSFLFTRERPDKNRMKLCYLLFLWIIVPWIIFSTYKGELSDYYFTLQLYMDIFVLAYISVWIWEQKLLVFKIMIGAFWLYYGAVNMQKFLRTDNGNLLKNKLLVKQAVEEGRRIEFSDGDPQSYLYFYYFYTQTGKMPYRL